MKKWLKILICTLLVLILAVGGMYLWQKENINALIKVLTTDSETIAQELAQTREEHLRELEEAAHVTVHVTPVTQQQSEDLLDGKVTVQEVQDQMGFDPGAAETVSTKEDILNQCIAELYAYKAEVMGTLGGIKQSILEQWRALPAAERTATKKAELGSAAIGQCYRYEATVDGRVQEILSVYRPKMIAIGEDPTPIDLLWKQYCDEKEAEKSYYMDKYMN